MEAEADYLGLQYLYKSGYDPTSFVDFFEKIQSLEKKKPGTLAEIFSSHPPTDDRIKAPRRISRRFWWPSPNTWSTPPSSTT